MDLLFETSVNLNHIPSKLHGTDIMRIRPWYLDGQARFYWQTIILGSYVNPDINALFNNHCLNFEGRVKLLHEHKGVLQMVLLQVRQIYERIDTESVMDADDARLDYFKKKVVLYWGQVVSWKNQRREELLFISNKVLLYDEPTAGLDPIASIVIEDLIRSVHYKGEDALGKPRKIASYVVVTHQQSTI